MVISPNALIFKWPLTCQVILLIGLCWFFLPKSRVEATPKSFLSRTNMDPCLIRFHPIFMIACQTSEVTLLDGWSQVLFFRRTRSELSPSFVRNYNFIPLSVYLIWAAELFSYSSLAVLFISLAIAWMIFRVCSFIWISNRARVLGGGDVA